MPTPRLSTPLAPTPQESAALASFATTAIASTSGAGLSVAVITHHKTGTVAAWNLIAALCCPEYKGGPGFWGPWGATCGQRCLSQGVTFDFDGVYDKNRNDPLRRDRVVHFVRHPVDVVVSGYLYHRSCHEPLANEAPLSSGWTNISPRVWSDYTDGAAVTVREALGAADGDTATSYCELLQHANASAGIEAETARSLAAYNGIGVMLNNVRRFGADAAGAGAGATDVAVPPPGFVCLESITPDGEGAEAEAAAAAGWARITDALGLPPLDATAERTRAWHSTADAERAHESRAELRVLAWAALRRAGRLSDADAATLRDFPCAVETSDALAAKGDRLWSEEEAD